MYLYSLTPFISAAEGEEHSNSSKVTKFNPKDRDPALACLELQACTQLQVPVLVFGALSILNATRSTCVLRNTSISSEFDVKIVSDVENQSCQSHLMNVVFSNARERETKHAQSQGRD